MKKTVYRIYEATAELKHRPSSVSEIVSAQNCENWITVGEYPDAESAVTALRHDRGTATVSRFPAYFLCTAAFVEEVTETIDEDGLVIDSDSESVEECEMPAPYDEKDLVTAESFGSDLPFNWEEIADYMNERIMSGDEASEVWEAYWNGEYSDAPKAVTEQFDVEYQGGESRSVPGDAVDYMLVNVTVTDEDGFDEEVELYAEAHNPTWNEATETFDDDAATYGDLKDAIIAQAKQHGINPKCLHFWYD